MMTSKHWIAHTKRGLFTPRSKRLVAVDEALSAYHNRPGTPTGIALFKALMAWIEKKGDNWKASTRNSLAEQPGGKGTVETLLREVIALNPTFAGQATKALGANKAPVGEIMKNGAKLSQKAANGRWYEIPIQSEENSCGPCCLRLVLKIVLNKDIGEEVLRELVEVAEEGGGSGGSLGKGGVLNPGGAHDWGPGGGGTWLIKGALEAAGVKSVRHYDNADALQTSTDKKPVIGVVAWANGGLHYVVAVGRNRSNDALVVLDPYYGAQSVPIKANGSPANYKPVDSNGTVMGEATWHPWSLAVL